MPRPAFVPGPIAEVQGRSFRNLRPRQLHGLAAGAAGAVAAASLTWGRPAALPLAFLSALPGFAYGFLFVRGRPCEYWLAVVWRYYSGTRAALARRKGTGHA